MHSSAASAFKACVDFPIEGTTVDPLCLPLGGWIWLGAEQQYVETIELWTGDDLIGRTNSLFARPDVSAALALPATTATGFELFGHSPRSGFGTRMTLRVVARLQSGDAFTAATRDVQTIPRDYRLSPYGNLLQRSTTEVHRSDTIFSSGPPVANAAPELLDLVRRHLSPPPCRMVDVGCGVGAYGVALRREGYDWFGVETKAEDCAELARLELPHRQADGYCLPFAEGTFDTALCLEVLEHVERPRAFLRELRRVAPQRLLVSVPNCELLSYLAPYQAVPWHILEKDHKSYFTRWSLEALLREVYQDVEVRFHTRHPLDTVEGTPLYYHLFAVASNRSAAR